MRNWWRGFLIGWAYRLFFWAGRWGFRADTVNQHGEIVVVVFARDERTYRYCFRTESRYHIDTQDEAVH